MFVKSLMPIADKLALVLSAIMGMIIVRGVKKEIILREHLEIANNNQASLIHFISKKRNNKT